MGKTIPVVGELRVALEPGGRLRRPAVGERTGEREELAT